MTEDNITLTRRGFFVALGAVAFEPTATMDRKTIDLRKEPEILEQHRSLPQILDAGNYVENVFLAVGYASRCWTEDNIFDSDKAIQVGNELCAIIRMHKEGRFP